MHAAGSDPIYLEAHHDIHEGGGGGNSTTATRPHGNEGEEGNNTIREPWRRHQTATTTIVGHSSGRRKRRSKNVRYPVSLRRVLYYPVPPLILPSHSPLSALPVPEVWVKRTNYAVNHATLAAISAAASSQLMAVGAAPPLHAVVSTLLCFASPLL